MRLSQIKLAGFKSFVDPVSFQVPGQLVAVVGPNGCGKSNIMDAVRWVLGESKASELRGESMLDVIFNGSSLRKPAARASVELIFDNQDARAGGQWSQYADIAVKRVLTRDGQSSYWVNGQQVRRKDVHDIFMGTGLGPRAYAIIGQGMIARIIEAKPEELRVFLEEAAGVSKYKERRRETQNRLKDTYDNLTRVDDILRELTTQIERLEQQAEVARRYKALQDSAQEKLHFLWLLRLDEASNEQNQINVAIAEHQMQYEAQKAGQHETELSIEQKRSSHYVFSERLNSAQAQLYEANSEVTKIESKLKFTEDNKARVQQQIDQIKLQRSQWTSKIELLEQELEQLHIQLQDAQEQLAAQEEVLAQSGDDLPELESKYKQSLENSQTNGQS